MYTLAPKIKKILVTGSAGFIGFHVVRKLLEQGCAVVGVDSLNTYYDPTLKDHRNDILKHSAQYTFYKNDVSEFDAFLAVVEKEKPDAIIHLAAQAGVRYSLQNPWAYEQANTLGTINVFEATRRCSIDRVILASSSSVYGANTKIPFSEGDITDSPVSLYAATKKSCELVAHTYHHLYGIKVAALRFFTVYGEYYRPDMALFIFAKRILQNQPIDLFNYGKMKRDFTYIDDIVDGLMGALGKKDLNYEIYNLGGDNPVELEYVVELLEKGLGRKAIKNYMSMQPGDVEVTYADITKARSELGYIPKVSIEEGLSRFCVWFLENKEWLSK